MFIYLFTIFFFVMLILDAIWLKFVFGGYVKSQLPGIIDTLNLIPAAIFYIIYAVGVSLFVLRYYKTNSLTTTFLLGCFFGLVCYASYDLTNQATISSWKTLITIIDVSWGAIVTGTSCIISILIYRYFF